MAEDEFLSYEVNRSYDWCSQCGWCPSKNYREEIGKCSKCGIGICNDMYCTSKYRRYDSLCRKCKKVKRIITLKHLIIDDLGKITDYENPDLKGHLSHIIDLLSQYT